MLTTLSLLHVPYLELQFHLIMHIIKSKWYLLVCIVLNCRDVDVTEKLDYSSAVALLGYSLILAILRSFTVRDEAARVMVAAPLIAFVTTHILYLNNFKLDYGIITSSIHYKMHKLQLSDKLYY